MGSAPKLQLALDSTLHDSISVLERVRPFIDLAEIGTPLIYREGLHAARHLRAHFPDLALLADLKIVDAGDAEATLGYDAGCEYVTVLGVSHDDTIRGVVNAARRCGGRVMVDLIEVQNVVERARHLIRLGCDVLCVHTGYDLQAANKTPLAGLRALRAALPHAPLAVAGGVTLAMLDAVLDVAPEIVVVGGAITRAPDPAAAARAFRERIDRA